MQCWATCFHREKTGVRIICEAADVDVVADLNSIDTLLFQDQHIFCQKCFEGSCGLPHLGRNPSFIKEHQRAIGKRGIEVAKEVPW